MLKIIDFFIFGLATWRIASLFVREDGPFFIFRRIRSWAGMIHDENGEVVIIPDNFLAQLLSCVWCTSIWMAVFMVLFDLFFPLIAIKFALIFALSALAIMIDRYVKG